MAKLSEKERQLLTYLGHRHRGISTLAKYLFPKSKRKYARENTRQLVQKLERPPYEFAHREIVQHGRSAVGLTERGMIVAKEISRTGISLIYVEEPNYGVRNPSDGGTV